MTTSVASHAAHGSTRTSWPPIIAVALAMLIVTSEISIAAVALPALGADLGVTPAAAAWVLLAFALPMGAMAIPAGRWADRADPRTLFLISMVGTGVMSVVAAAAPAMWVLLVARFLQGLFGGLVLVVYMPIVVESAREELRGRAVSVIVTIMTAGGMAGAAIGGVAAGAFGWRSVFLLKLPLLIPVLILAVRSLPRADRGLPAPGRTLVMEALLLGGAVSAVLLAFNGVAERPVLAGALVVAAVILTLMWKRQPASAAIIQLMRQRAFGFTIAGLFFLGFNVALMVFLVPYFVADVLALGPEVVGMLMLIEIAAMSLVSPLAGWLADRHGELVIAAIGAALTVGATLIMVTLGEGATTFDLAWQLALMGIGFGLFNTPVIAAIMAAAPAGATGTAGGISGTTRMMASTIAPAVAALAWTLADGGVAGFRAGVLVLVVVQALGFVALLAARGRGAATTRA
ncbi:MFS transporter [Hoyosella subflava]|uniref:Major facilitator superfamily MFS_1 n=1 Tax=Hoyosella subflava (strain DSM 45089 / JCM 17490 / NBRC 109087 / DQS3-9A1) TaxID=443218 RepID=F6EN52_HOYSD|nr:MFS transporter [Hoyosella subflava]AEF39369.1 Major facilitator superfamily MFS_1 [Hoyosella subflava DQS3-9A1]